MANNDPRRIIEIRANPDGNAELYSVREGFRQLSEMIYTLEGRTGGVGLRDTLTVQAQTGVAASLQSFSFPYGNIEFGFTGARGDNAYIAKGAHADVNNQGAVQWTALARNAVVIRFIGPNAYWYSKPNLDIGQPFVLGDPNFSISVPNAASTNTNRFRMTTNPGGTGDYTWDTTDIASGPFTLQTADTELLCEADGTYQIIAQLGAVGTAVASPTAEISVNSTQVSYISQDLSATLLCTFTISWLGHLSEGDVVKVTLLAGSSRNGAGGTGQSAISLIKIA